MNKTIERVERTTDSVCVLLMSIAFLITFVHIIGRYLLNAPIYFSEELARYCFIWASVLGASIVHRQDEHTSVTYFVGLLPERARTWLAILRSAAIIILFIVLIYQGLVLSYKMRTVYSAAMGWSWALLYSALPVASILMIVSTVRHIARRMRELKAL